MPIQLSGSLVITGSITTTGVITMSGSIASASYSSTSDLLQGTGSVGFTTTASFLAVSSSQQQVSASYIALSGSYNTFSGSASTRITVDSASLLQVSASQQQISASYIALSGSYNVFSGSASTRVTQIEQVYATTGSNSFRANQSITGSLVVSSTITAQTLVVQTVTSSILYSSGSNIFGNQLANTQTFTGSVNITGSLALAGNITSNGTAVVLGSGTTNYLPKFTGASTIGNSAVFDNGTNVGIGTSSPQAKFSIGSPAAITSFPTYSTNDLASIGWNYFALADELYVRSMDIVSKGAPDGTNGGSIMRFLTTPVTNASAAIERMRITSGGNVGIGTISPNLSSSGTSLTVNAASSANAAIEISDGGTLAGLIFGRSGTGVNLWSIPAIPLIFGTNNAEHMRITSGGYTKATNNGSYYNSAGGLFHEFDQSTGNQDTMWIYNTASSGYGLTINMPNTAGNGTNYFLRALNSTSSYFLYSNGSSTFSSDRNLKKNIETTRDGYLEDLMNLRVVKYNWNTQEDGEAKELGLIAQEVAEVFPSLVVDQSIPRTREIKQEDGSIVEEQYEVTQKGLKVSVLPFMLLKAIQEQQIQIQNLQEQINILAK